MLNYALMQTVLSKLNSTKVELKITADSHELFMAKKAAIKELSKDLKIPGFRPGAAPENLAEKHLNPNTLAQETLELAVNTLYGNAIINEQLRVVNNPQIDVGKYVPFESLEFSATVNVVGEVKLGKYQGLNIESRTSSIGTGEVNTVIDRLRRQLATKEEVHRAIKPNDEAVIDFNGIDSQTKEVIDGASGKDYPLIIGSNTFIPGFEDNLIGVKPEAELSFDLKFPLDYQVSFLRGKSVNFTVKVKNVNELKLPPLDDNLAMLVGPFKTLGELKTDIKRELRKNNEQQALATLQNKLVDQILAGSTVDIPDALIDEETSRIEQETRSNATYRGQTWSEYLKYEGLSEKEFAEQAKTQALLHLKTGLILGAIASKEGVSVSEDELTQYVTQLKTQYKADEQMQTELNKPANLNDLRNRLMVEKTLDRLVLLNQAKPKAD